MRSYCLHPVILRLVLFLLILIGLPLIVVGCGTSSITETIATAAVSISASPTTVVPGGTSVLQIVSKGATQVVLTGSDGSSYSMSATGGTQTVKPAASTTYTASATGVSNTASAQVTILVAPVAIPPVPAIIITASPATILPGAASSLNVSAANATNVVVTGSDDSLYTLAATGGTQAVTPTASTTYTATASSPSGMVTATALVTVAPASPPSAPTVKLEASPSAISAGASATLLAVATNATNLTLTGSDGSFYTIASTGGMQTVSPAATTTYTATANGPGGKAIATSTINVTPVPVPQPSVTITASPAAITAGSSSMLSIAATNSTSVVVTGSDNSSYTLSPSGGIQAIHPAATTTYTATAIGPSGTATSTVVLTVTAAPDLSSVQHVVFMLQENHTFDNYFGMLNPYRQANHFNVGDDGQSYSVDGIDDKLQTISNPSDDGTTHYPLAPLTSTCIDDLSSSWLESYGDVSRYDFSLSRGMNMDGFVHTAAGYAATCQATAGKSCSGTMTDFSGARAMGYYDQGFLNYYYYMASQFAVSDRWFSPVSSKSVPNRIATFTGGTTQGLAFDPGTDDRLPQLDIKSIFQELSENNVSWKLYYTVTQGACLSSYACSATASAQYPATDYSFLSDANSYLYQKVNAADGCRVPLMSSNAAVGDPTDSFCIDLRHIAPLSVYQSDLANGTLPQFAFIEAGYGNNDEHPGSGQSVLAGQAQVAGIVTSLMASSSWSSSVFFLAYDEGGGPYDHVPPVPHHSNDALPGNTPVSGYPDISGIAVNPDSYAPCLPPAIGTATTHCDLNSAGDPGANSADAPAKQSFAAQLGFRVPNMIISPFTKRHYVGHNPMDHTAVLKFVENRFIGPNISLTARDAAQPDLLDFFDFRSKPWEVPPTPPTPVNASSLSYDPCTPTSYSK